MSLNTVFIPVAIPKTLLSTEKVKIFINTTLSIAAPNVAKEESVIIVARLFDDPPIAVKPRMK
jgi:hypothetical protein